MAPPRDHRRRRRDSVLHRRLAGDEEARLLPERRSAGILTRRLQGFLREETMANPKLRFYFREPTIDTNIAITDGTVKAEGFDFEFVPSEDEADAWDCGFAARVRAYAKRLPPISIPAFPNRKFRLAYIFVNGKADIESPKDLEGRRVGIMQWDNTAGVWARGALQHYYGVDLTRIRWLAVKAKKEGVADG